MPQPDPTFLAMAAAQMHGEGKFEGSPYGALPGADTNWSKTPKQEQADIDKMKASNKADADYENKLDNVLARQNPDATLRFLREDKIK